MATPPAIMTAFMPSWYSRPSITGIRASYDARRWSTPVAAWIALTPFHERAEWARSPRVITSKRSVPWQPASTTASEGSIRIAKSEATSSGELSAILRSPLWTASISSHS